jgi:hypothetical protein
MQILNDTPFVAAALPGLGPEGQPVFTLVIKGTYEVATDGRLAPAAEPVPILYGDEPLGDRGAVRFEADTAPFKPRADVVVAASACAPGDQPVPFLDVGVRVGERRCTLRVIGDRRWEKESRFSSPTPFTRMQLSAERAFGGIALSGGFCAENPVGTGFLVVVKKDDPRGTPLPNIETAEAPIRTWNDQPHPVGFGVYPRTAQPRLAHLGTFDARWREERAPLPPEDFRFDAYNCAYPQLQFEGYLHGDEEVELLNLSPDGRLLFRLPGEGPQVLVRRFGPDVRGAAGGSGCEEIRPAGPPEELIPVVLDTLLLVPEARQVALVWRGLCPVAALDVPEVREVQIGLARAGGGGGEPAAAGGRAS